MKSVLLAILLAGAALAQSKFANPGFEQGNAGGVPTGWMLPQMLADAGFGAKTVEDNCRTGARCAMLTGVANPPQNMFGNLIQTLPTAGYKLRRIRMTAAIRVEGEATRAQMWLRLDRADRSMAFLENMQRNPVISSEWKTYSITTDVPGDAATIVAGFMLFGPGKAWVDDVTLEILDEIHTEPAEAARPLTAQGLTNLTAFAKLYGYVRMFHPSDEAAAADWERFAVLGVRAVEAAESIADLQARLTKLFQPVAPTLQIFSGAAPAAPAVSTKPPHFIRYEHQGIGLLESAVTYNLYKSPRAKNPVSGPLPEPFTASIAPGLRAGIPLALYVDDDGTLPHTPRSPKPELYQYSAEDRAVRLADVVIAWNVFQHFYPYFDVVKTDWAAELPKGLRAAATDAGPVEFEKTLARMVAALKDGHGRVGGPNARPQLVPPVTLDWIEGQFLVTRAQSAAQGIAPGDRVLKIDGKPIDQAAAEARALISGATDQWIRSRLAADLSVCSGARMALEIEPFSTPGTTRIVDLPCGPRKFKDPETYTEPRPTNKITELEPGIFYVDLDRVADAEWSALAPRLAAAKGIIFDMRGYPGQSGVLSLQHITGDTIRSAKWNVPSVPKPDRVDFGFTESGWDLKPAEPRFKAPRVFLTDGRAISYAETVMGIVEFYKLGAIVGGPTAGTNGNVNPFRLSGGYNLSWTGMKVLKHDGSQHHGIGILPTHPASRTRKGVAEGKDEILQRGLEVVKTGGR
ncbi:MAG: S41 family peptidase [Candidatus Solibacter sp.]